MNQPSLTIDIRNEILALPDRLVGSYCFGINLVQKWFHRKVAKHAEKDILSEFLRGEF